MSKIIQEDLGVSEKILNCKWQQESLMKLSLRNDNWEQIIMLTWELKITKIQLFSSKCLVTENK